MSSGAKQRLLSDSDEQVREKVHGIFACSTRQSNWRATFTPSKNSVFSRQQLTSLYCKAATVITNVLLAIASNLHAATVVPRAPGQRRNCSFWLLPNLCGEKSMKSNILPLGFNFHPPPDPSKRFDSPMCSESSDLPWKLFEGCWHSFHISCLNGKNFCVICQDGLNRNMKSLSKTANEAFVQGLQTAPATGEQLQECDEVEERGNGDDDDDHDIPEVGEVSADQVILELTRKLFNTQINQLSDTNATSCAPVVNVNRTGNQRRQTTGSQRPIHCTVCNHRRQGHQRQTSQTGEVIYHCFYCPNNVCCGGGGGVPCSCEWCDQTLDQSSSGTSQMTRGPVVVHQNQQGDVTEWVISVCQSSVSGELGSNACTIIAVLVAVNFLLPTGWILPCPQNNLPQAFTRMFKELMVQGNIVHQWLGHAQQTYSAPEIIQHPLLGFSGVARCGDEYQFTSFQQFSTELESIIINSGRTKMALVLILPPDKSMVLLINELGQLVLLESHKHMGIGGIVAATGTSKVKEMVFYIEDMAKRDWGGNLVPFDVSFVKLV